MFLFLEGAGRAAGGSLDFGQSALFALVCTIKLLMFIFRNVLQMHFSLFPSLTVGTLFLFIK